jgi:hypothetical protein
MDIESILKLSGQLGITAVVLVMVLRFLFKIVEKKFENGEDTELKNLKNNIEINNSLKGISKSVDKVSHSQEKITNSQTKLATLIELTYNRMNGGEQG